MATAPTLIDPSRFALQGSFRVGITIPTPRQHASVARATYPSSKAVVSSAANSRTATTTRQYATSQRPTTRSSSNWARRPSPATHTTRHTQAPTAHPGHPHQPKPVLSPSSAPAAGAPRAATPPDPDSSRASSGQGRIRESTFPKKTGRALEEGGGGGEWGVYPRAVPKKNNASRYSIGSRTDSWNRWNREAYRFRFRMARSAYGNR